MSKRPINDALCQCPNGGQIHGVQGVPNESNKTRWNDCYGEKWQDSHNIKAFYGHSARFFVGIENTGRGRRSEDAQDEQPQYR